jgi:putative restriction endonuclease
MKLYLGNTDIEWYNYLSKINPEDINFWQPGSNSGFNVLKPGEPYLFRLKKPYNAIGGVGFFVSYTKLPLSLAWQTFFNRNGFEVFEDFEAAIQNYRKRNQSKFEADPLIGCIVLTNPIFFDQKDWMQVPVDWARGIVQGKSYSTENEIGKNLWTQLEYRILRTSLGTANVNTKDQLVVAESQPLYGNPILTRVRLGQGGFRILVTDAYARKCAITGEKTLPVLEAAHIKQYAKSGPHHVSNGLLLRSDVHKLFDNGYITVTPDYKVEVSKKIKEEYENGKEYYQYHGRSLIVLPPRDSDKPNTEYLKWHNNIFRG